MDRERRPAPRLTFWASLLALCVLLAALAGGCAASQGDAAGLEGQQVVSVERGDVVDRVQVGGQIGVLRQAKLSFDLPLGQQALLKTLEVKAGQFVPAGQVIATMDTATLERAVQEAQTDLQNAQKALEQVNAPAKASELALAHVAVTRARTELRQAEKALETLQKPDLGDLQGAVADAEHDLAVAQLDRRAADRASDVGKNVRDLEYALAWQQRRQLELAELARAGRANVEQAAELAGLQAKIGETSAALALARQIARQMLADADAAIQKAGADLETARAALAEAQAGADAVALAKGQDAVSSAQLTLSLAEEAEAKLKAGPDPDARARAEADVTDKQRVLDEAQAALRRTRLVAPIAGYIAALPAQVGEFITSRTVIAELHDLTSMLVYANVDETDIPKLRAGLPATLTMDAFPGQTFKGIVGAIPLQGKLQGDILVFEVPVTFEYGELPLKPNMSVLLAIELGRADNALRLPSMAIQTDAGGVFVRVAGGVRPRRQPITIGVSDGAFTEIVSGLQENDIVVVPPNAYQAPARGGASSGVKLLP